MKKIMMVLMVMALISSLVGAVPIDTATQEILVNPGETTSFNVTLSTETINRTIIYSMSYFSAYFPFSISPSTIISTNETSPYNMIVTASIPTYYPSGSYDNTLILREGNITTYNKTVRINVNSTAVTNISSNNSTLNVSSGTNGSTTLTIYNLGNENIEINPAIQDNVKMFPSIFTLFRGKSQDIRFDYIIPSDFVGEMDRNFILGNSTYHMIFHVNDTTTPSIINISIPSEIRVNDVFKVLTTITDNTYVKKVRLFRTYPNLTELEMNPEVNNSFYAFITFNQTGTYLLNITAWDRYDNVVSNLTSINVTCLPFTTNHDIKAPKTKAGSKVGIVLFDTEKPIDISIDKYNITTNLPENVTYNLEYQLFVDGDVRTYTPGKVFQVQKTVEMKFTFDKELYYDGKISITIQDQYCNRNREITFSGNIGNYSVTNAFSGIIFGKDYSCSPSDMGNYEGSYLLCSNKMPVDTLEKDVYMACSKKDLEDREARYNAEIKDRDDKISDLGLKIIVSWCIFVVAACATYYFFRIHPNTTKV